MSERLRHDIDTERAVLGSILLDLDGHQWAAHIDAGLTSEDFFRAGHRIIFGAMLAIDEDGDRVEMLAVRKQLEDSLRLDEAGGASYLYSLCDGLPLGLDASWAVRRLKALSNARAAVKAAQALVEANDLDAATLAEHAACIDALLVSDHPGESGTDAMAQVAALHASRQRERGQALHLGIPTIDETLDGLRAGEVCGIMARTSVGKTLVACHVARTLCAAGAGVVFVSLEMAQGQIVERLARLVTQQTRHQLRWSLDNGRFDAGQYRAAYATLHVADTPGLTLRGIERLVRSLQRRQSIGVVVIDYLGLVSGERGQSIYERTSGVVKQLKDSAKRLGVAIIPLIQVSRQSGDDGAQELALGSARDSGVIEEAMDYMVALRRLDRSSRLGDADRDRFKDVIFARVIKNRHGSISYREVAVRVDPVSLVLSEDPTCHVDEHTNARTKRNETRFGS